MSGGGGKGRGIGEEEIHRSLEGHERYLRSIFFIRNIFLIRNILLIRNIFLGLDGCKVQGFGASYK